LASIGATRPQSVEGEGWREANRRTLALPTLLPLQAVPSASKRPSILIPPFYPFSHPQVVGGIRSRARHRHVAGTLAGVKLRAAVRTRPVPAASGLSPSRLPGRRLDNHLSSPRFATELRISPGALVYGRPAGGSGEVPVASANRARRNSTPGSSIAWKAAASWSLLLFHRGRSGPTLRGVSLDEPSPLSRRSFVVRADRGARFLEPVRR